MANLELEGQQDGSSHWGINTRQWIGVIGVTLLHITAAFESFGLTGAKIQLSVGSYCKTLPPAVLQIQYGVDFANIKGNMELSTTSRESLGHSNQSRKLPHWSLSST